MSDKKKFPRTGFGRLAGDMVRRYYTHDVARDSAALTYYLLFAIFPLLIFISTLLGLLELDGSYIASVLEPLLPADVLNVLQSYLDYVSANQSRQLLWFSLVFSIWFPMRAAGCLMHSVRKAFGCGAPESILVDAKPHVGTDMLHIALQNLRQELLSLGAQMRFGHRLEGLESRDGVLTGLHVRTGEGTYRLPVRAVVLAPGHSARDTFQMLYEAGVPMEAKPFAVGVRIEHRQRDMDAAQYRQYAGHPCLPASTYKLSCHTAAGRGVFSFCVCPGGQVVAAASEPGRVVTNGMSHYARSGENINGGMLVGVTPEDFGTDHPLAGVAWQRQLEEAAFRLGGGGFLAPCQRVEDFLAHRPSTGPGAVLPSYRPGVTWCDLHDCLPSFLTEAMEQALPLLERKLRGYAQPDALLTAVETRSSSPVRILRDESGQSALRGLYPCGEGAGYAGGILSAAADGMRCAEKIWEVYS